MRRMRGRHGSGSTRSTTRGATSTGRHLALEVGVNENDNQDDKS